MRWTCRVMSSKEGWQMQQGQNAEALLHGFAEEQHSPCPKSASDVLQTSCQEQLICHCKSGIKMGERCKMPEEQEKPVLLSATADVLLLLFNGFLGSNKGEDTSVQRELAVPCHKEKASNTEKGSATKIHGSEEYTHRRNGWGTRLQGKRSAGAQLPVSRVPAAARTRLPDCRCQYLAGRNRFFSTQLAETSPGSVFY